MRALRILYEDEHVLAADKPAGFYSMPSEDKSLAHSFHWDALHILERQKGMRLYPAHRLDRATSGILLLSKKLEGNGALQRQFQERSVDKAYYCVVRGRLEGEASIETPLKKEDGRAEEARTHAAAIAHFSLPIPGPQGGEREFTFVRANPETGRFHQIRRHLASISLPLVGDQRHGDRKVNRAFAELTGAPGLLLRCMGLSLRHPASAAPLVLRARWAKEWHKVFDAAGFCPRPD
jgi:tRNA pseudouridine65 synthase